MWMDGWYLLICLLLPNLSYSADSCPRDCHCLPELMNPHRLKITCKRRFIAGRAEFSSFPDNSTVSLSVHCTEDSRISDLSPGIFSQFQNLRHLKLHKCSPKSPNLPRGLFRGLQNLKTLHLDQISAGNDGLAIHSGLLSPLGRLEKLSITGSHIRRFPSRTFCNLLELKLLNLSNNWISHIDSIGYDSKRNCPNHLVLLDLSKNHLTKIGKSEFK